jgi:transcription elongation factor B subunit 1
MADTQQDEKQSHNMIKLKSAEGHEFFVDRRCAMVSGTIKTMLSGQFAESRGEISFPEIPGAVLERLIQYLHYKVRYTNSSQRIPEFQIDPEIALELLLASAYLDC